MERLEESEDPFINMASSYDRPRSLHGGTILRATSRLCGTLELDQAEALVGDRITVTWDITYVRRDEHGEHWEEPPQPSERDWIGIFKTDDLDPESFLAYKMRGENLDNHGQIQWTLSSQHFQDEVTDVCFCFFTRTNVLLAQSDTLKVMNTSSSVAQSSDATPASVTEPVQLVVKDIQCNQLHVKVFAGIPDPYLKLKVKKGAGRPPTLPHHSNPIKTSSIVEHSENPVWRDEEIQMEGVPTDILEVEVRDKFSPSRPAVSHFLGKVAIPLDFVESERYFNHNVNLPLQKRLPTDKVRGTISLTICGNTTLRPPDHPPPRPLPTVSEMEDTPPSSLEEPPSRTTDRLRLIRHTLHGAPNRRSSFSHRPHQRTTPSDNFTSSLIVDRQAPPTPSPDPLSESMVLTVPSEERNVAAQFLLRASRNQLMRQQSCPVQRREPRAHPTEADSSATPDSQIESQIEVHVEAEINIEPTNTENNSPSPTTESADPPVIITPNDEEGEQNEDVFTHQKEDDTNEQMLTAPPTFNRLDSVDESFKDHPGFLFVTRPDFYEYVKSSGNNALLKDLALLQLIQSIRSDHSLFARYVHSSKFVRTINSFAATDYELPDGWEKRVDRKSNKAVFIDHNSRQTTFIDPRLPYPGNNLIKGGDLKPGVMRSRPVRQRTSSSPMSQNATVTPTRSATDPPPPPPPPPPNEAPPPPPPPPIPPSAQQAPQTYSEQVVAFLRQSNIYAILASRSDVEIPAPLRTVIDSIITGGVSTLESLSTDSEDLYFDLSILLSLFNEEITHQIFESTPLQVGDVPLPPPPPPPLPTDTPPSPPRVSPPPTRSSIRRTFDPAEAPDMDAMSTTYAGMSMEDIITFFNLPNIYRIVLTRYDGIQPYMRTYITNISSCSRTDVMELLTSDRQARGFVYGLSLELMRSVRAEETAEVDDGELPSALAVARFMAQPNILEVLSRDLELSPDERSIVRVCGSWDTALIQFELNRASVLEDLVRRIAPQIREYARNPPTPPPVPSVLQSAQAPLSPLRVSSNTLQSSMFQSGGPPPPPPVPSILPSAEQPLETDRGFVQKMQQLQSVLDVNGYCSSSYGSVRIRVRRDHLLEDAYRAIMGNSAKNLRRKTCSVSWDREEGLDYGGPMREFFFRLSQDLFNPYYGLFEYTSQGSYTIQISRFSAQIDEAPQWFRFAGRMIGYTIIQSNLLDVFFARHFYKALLGRPFSVSDVEALDPAFYNSLQYVVDNDPEPLELYFTVQEESFGELIEKDLKPKGSTILVTEANKKEYVELMLQWRLAHGVQEQMEHLVKGLKEMIPLEYLQPFDAKELEWVIAGTPEINMEDWKRNTIYYGGYSESDIVIRWFWEAMESFTDEQKLKFLQFATGTSSIPYEGFRGLKGSSNQLQKFTIDKYSGQLTSLPIAHTCFNRIDLPPYPSKEAMREKLLYAILETGTFESA